VSQQINLFNPVFLNQRKLFSVVTMLQALGLIVVGAALFYAYALYQINAANQQSEAVSKRTAAEQTKLSNFLTGYSSEESNKLLENELKQATTKAEILQKQIEILKAGGNTTGYSEYMRAFARRDVHGLWLTEFYVTGDPAQITIKGNVLSPELLPEYVRALGKEPVMRGISFSSLQMRRGDNGQRYVQFTLTSGANGAAKP
jgi:hypothetical protein